MPLHLLGKKSWNVYNSANIDRVRRDEAEAKAKEEAEEQRMQQEDAQRRIALLRGEIPPAVTYKEEEPIPTADDHHQHRDRKRRRIRGEDDTDRDIRYARQDTEAGLKARKVLVRDSDKDAALQDEAGNIQLFPAPDPKTERNREAEAEKAQKRKRNEGEHNMRFSDAAGSSTGMERPWYAARGLLSTAEEHNKGVLAHVQSKDVWGNEDPLRKERERTRLSTNDPLGAMRQAQRQLKQSEKDREAWRKKQIAELQGAYSRSRPEKDRSDRRSHRRHNDGIDELDLDAPADTKRERHRHRHRHDEHRQQSPARRQRDSRHKSTTRRRLDP